MTMGRVRAGPFLRQPRVKAAASTNTRRPLLAGRPRAIQVPVPQFPHLRIAVMDTLQDGLGLNY